ncbi:2-polyprenyl-6-methoxyphenol hydroxylase-like FAD-dependent oxidoreductase [Sphingomonas vulcanisoli]|uniref:2-polyprenyl-6-methoxyphenol hydroxylase-like FAD-dependent oxidoreductase n=1 Tax=Sphingomonas vulcanisoli TaxID=1658060 RepID=A0ABX0TP38_9SPHN|nr:flavin-dependent oxidoreductase [Sphingomonas vulcanisoli]NIJ07298.1 2-polyprenyl-6-methoxyphenol hydroxylase-like FAD-dependent oxidoreductase [Sphingomonas vulcanisoli]
METSLRIAPRIAIVGGGIAGLALALGLHRHGIAAQVYEAAPEINEIGVGITLLPHGMREIAALGLEEKILAAGIENRESAFFNRFGQKLFAEPRGKLAGYPQPEIGIHRGRLHGILLAAVRDRLGADAVATDHHFVGLEQTDTDVTLHFKAVSDASARAPVTADVVIACDGVNSAVRRIFYPDESVAFTGINTWRGVTRRKPIFDGRTYMRIGSIKTGKIVVYPIVDDIDGSGDQLINWIAEIETDRNHRNDWNQKGDRADFLPIYESFKFDWLDVGQLIRDADTVLEYPMVDKDPVDQWTFGRVTFAGDAAHPMYPRGSNGSAQALIDVRTLADLLAAQIETGGDARAAFAAYESERRPATAEIVRTNRVSPPDIINLKVEELVGDRPFDDLDRYISQAELRDLSDRYKRVAGFSVERARS